MNTHELMKRCFYMNTDPDSSWIHTTVIFTCKHRINRFDPGHETYLYYRQRKEATNGLRLKVCSKCRVLAFTLIKLGNEYCP